MAGAEGYINAMTIDAKNKREEGSRAFQAESRTELVLVQVQVTRVGCPTASGYSTATCHDPAVWLYPPLGLLFLVLAIACDCVEIYDEHEAARCYPSQCILSICPPRIMFLHLRDVFVAAQLEHWYTTKPKSCKNKKVTDLQSGGVMLDDFNIKGHVWRAPWHTQRSRQKSMAMLLPYHTPERSGLLSG
jgi:hypothetical protein